MKLKIVDTGGMKYPQVVNAETGEKIDDIISIEYEATANGRICTMRFIGEADLEFEVAGQKDYTGVQFSAKNYMPDNIIAARSGSDIVVYHMDTGEVTKHKARF